MNFSIIVQYFLEVVKALSVAKEQLGLVDTAH